MTGMPRRSSDTRERRRPASLLATGTHRRLRRAVILLIASLPGSQTLAQARLDTTVPPPRDAAAMNTENTLDALGWIGVGLLALAALVGFAMFAAVTAARSRRPRQGVVSIVGPARSRPKADDADP